MVLHVHVCIFADIHTIAQLKIYHRKFLEFLKQLQSLTALETSDVVVDDRLGNCGRRFIHQTCPDLLAGGVPTVLFNMLHHFI